MPRAMWSGSISFGLVNIPVKLYTAARSRDIGFNQLHSKDGARLQMKRVCSADGQEVPFDEIAKGYEFAKDRYVLITQAELDALAPEVTNGIDIESFVSLDEIDPLYFENSYYLAPDKSGVKAYGLLLAAMRASSKIALGRVVLRSKQYLVALRPVGNALAMETLYFPDEVMDRSELPGLPEDGEVAGAREMTMAQQLISALTQPFDPSQYRDEYRERVLALIDEKAAGHEVAPERKTTKPVLVDLMAALEASIAASQKATATEAETVPTAKKRTSRANGSEAAAVVTKPRPVRKVEPSEAAAAPAPAKPRAMRKTG